MARKNKIDNNTIMIIVILLVILLLSSFGLGFGYMGGMMFFGPIFMILTIVVIVWLVVSLSQDN